MRAKKNWIVPVILLAIFWAVLQVTQVKGNSEQDTKTTSQTKYVSQRDALAGLEGVYVFVEGFKPNTEKYGLNSEMIKAGVEFQLRQHGVKVLSDAGMLLAENHPRLYINLYPHIDEKVGIVSVSISVELHEYVMLIRSTSKVANAVTWKSRTLSIRESNRPDKLKEDIKDRVGRFINSYLAVNPKQKRKGQKVLSTIDSIQETKLTWVLCRNDECKAAYQMGLREYFEYIQANANPMGPAPTLTCKKCGKQTVFRAFKCKNPDCGIVFVAGSVPNDFHDRCPKCGHSETEEIRKRRKRTRDSR